MTYELAKELKDAGFPQKGEFTFCRCRKDGWGFKENKIYPIHEAVLDENGYMFERLGIIAPSLSELIEAIPKVRFISLESCIPNDLCHWRATGLQEDASKVYKDGNTPEEVVAKLYIALNKKPK